MSTASGDGADGAGLVFISYSHDDAKWAQRFRVLLKPLVRVRRMQLWDDTVLRAGDAWHPEIERAILRSRLALLLVSADYLASDYVMDHELPALRRHGVRLAPVLIADCFWNAVPELATVQWLHDIERDGALSLIGDHAGERDRAIRRACERLLEVTPEPALAGVAPAPALPPPPGRSAPRAHSRPASARSGRPPALRHSAVPRRPAHRPGARSRPSKRSGGRRRSRGRHRRRAVSRAGAAAALRGARRAGRAGRRRRRHRDRRCRRTHRRARRCGPARDRRDRQVSACRCSGHRRPGPPAVPRRRVLGDGRRAARTCSPCSSTCCPGSASARRPARGPMPTRGTTHGARRQARAAGRRRRVGRRRRAGLPRHRAARAVALHLSRPGRDQRGRRHGAPGRGAVPRRRPGARRRGARRARRDAARRRPTGRSRRSGTFPLAVALLAAAVRGRQEWGQGRIRGETPA